MKRILSMLLVLVMVISMLPMAVFAAEVATGYASTTSADTKWTYSYTAPADGTLTITVGDGSAEWVSDVMNFSTFKISEAVSGKAQASYDYAVTAGTSYSIRIYGPGSTAAAISDIPYTITFTSASGEEDTGIEVKGTVMKDVSGATMSGTNVAVTASSQINHVFTPSADGVVTVHVISASESWKYTGEGIPSVEGTGEAAPTFEVVGGQKYSISLGCYADYDWAAGTISYEILFYESELTATQEPYIISETVIEPAEEAVTKTISMEENADMTVVTITPTVTGVFTITVPEGALLNNVGGGSHYIEAWDTTEAATSIEWTCAEVYGQYLEDAEDGTPVYSQGQSLMLGIKSDATAVAVTVEKTADYTDTEADVVVYENKALDVDVPVQGDDEEDEAFEERYNAFVQEYGFVLPEGATLGSYVDVYTETAHTAVLGDDGNYHLDSADGDVLLIDMNYNNIVLSDALKSDRPVMYTYVTLEDGTEVKYDIGAAVQEYEAVMDANGYYPLTEDLILFYEVYATGAGTWVYHLNDDGTGANADVWMYCCRTVTLPEEETPSEPDGSITNPYVYETVGALVADWQARSVDAGAIVYVTAPLGGATLTITSTDTAACMTNTMGANFAYNAEPYTFSESEGFTAGQVVTIGIYNQNPYQATTATLTAGTSEGGEEGGETEVTYTDLTIGNNAIEAADAHWSYTAASAGTLNLALTTAIMGDVAVTYTVNDGEAQTLAQGANVDLTLAANDVVKIDVTAAGYATLTAAWSGESSGEEGGEETTNTLVLGDNALKLAADDVDGDTWTYTVAEDGTLTATISYLKYYTPSYEVEGEFDAYEATADTDLQGACGRLVQFLVNGNNAYTNTQSVSVKAGDVVTVQLISNYNYETEATLNLAMGEGGESTEPDGSQSNPYVIESLPFETSFEGSHDVYYTYTVVEDGTLEFKISAGNYCSGAPANGTSVEDETYKTYTLSVTAGQVLSINPWGSNAGILSVAVKTEEETPAEPGTQSNPIIIESIPAEVTVSLTDDNASTGLFYQYTVAEDGMIDVATDAYATVMIGEENISLPYSATAGEVITFNFWSWWSGDYATKVYDPSVAKVGDTVYTSLEAALTAAQSGDVVTLVADAVVDGYVVLPVGVSLDLGDYDLTADYIYGSKDSKILATPNSGKLIVPQGNLILGAGATNEKGQYVLPVWDPSSSAYVFSLFVVNTDNDARGLFIDEEAEQIYFQFKHQATGAINQTLLADGASDNELSVIILLEWTNENGAAYQHFVYNDAQVGMVAGVNDYNFTLTGYTALNIDLSTLVVTAIVETNSGADAIGTSWTAQTAK